MSDDVAVAPEIPENAAAGEQCSLFGDSEVEVVKPAEKSGKASGKNAKKERSLIWKTVGKAFGGLFSDENENGENGDDDETV